MCLSEGRCFIQEQQTQQPKPVPAQLIQVLILNPLPALLPFPVPFLIPNTASLLVLIPVQISNPSVVTCERRGCQSPGTNTNTARSREAPSRSQHHFSPGPVPAHPLLWPGPKGHLVQLGDGGHCKTDPAPVPGLCAGRETGQSSSRSPSPGTGRTSSPSTGMLHPRGVGRLGPGLMLILLLGLSSSKVLLFCCPDRRQPRACRAEGRRCWGPCLRRCPTAGSRASQGGALPSLVASKLPAKGGFGRGTRCS